MSKQNVTLKDIAEEVGITTNSVSRALKNSKEISESTKEKVREVANKLGYVPNTVASSLRNGKTNVIAIVFDNMINPYFNIMTEKIQKRLMQEGYDVMIFTSFDSMLNIRDYNKIKMRKVDGIITFIEPSKEVIYASTKAKIPLILLGRLIEDNSIDTIVTDDIKGGYLACEALLQKGCKRLAYVGAKDNVECSKRRLKGFKQCLFDHQMDLDESLIYLTELGETISKEVLENFKNQADGIFCFNDVFGIDFYSYLGSSNISIIGYDNIQEQLFASKILTTISSNKEDITSYVVKRMLEKIAGDDSIVNYVFSVSVCYGASCK